MNKRKLLFSFLLFIALVMVLVACGTAKLTEYSDLDTQNGEATVESVAVQPVSVKPVSVKPVSVKPVSVKPWWQPEADSNMHWHYQIGRNLNGPVWDSGYKQILETPNDLDLLSQADAATIKVIALDLFDNSVENIQALQASGRNVICYVNVGARENWRFDDHLFTTDIGAYPGWPGEYYLDTRSPSLEAIQQELGENYTEELATKISEPRQLIRNLITLRFLLAKHKGCDGIEPDNIDYWLFNQEGKFNADDFEDKKIRFNFAREYLIWMSDLAHNGLETEAEVAQFNSWLQDPKISYINPFYSGSEAEATLNAILAEIKQSVQASATQGTRIDIGISIGLKNGTGLLHNNFQEGQDHYNKGANGENLVSDLIDQFDWAMNESCAQWNECGEYSDTFVKDNKAVFWVEYSGSLNDYCSLESANGMSHMLSKSYKVNKANVDSKRLVGDISRPERCTVSTPPPPPADTTTPTITASLTPEVPSSGWYGQDVSEVSVSFSCIDEGSGVKEDTVTSLSSVTAEGVNSIEGTCGDNAGNAASLTVEVKIDRSAPTVTVEGFTAETATCEVKDQDDLSGLNESDISKTVVDGPEANQKTVTCTGTATDNAGNSATLPISKTFNMIPPPVEKPVVTAEVVGTEGNNGWYTQATVRFSCTGADTDTLSGEEIQLTDGSGQSASSADVAGAVCSNAAGDAEAVSSAPVNVDSTDPTVSVTGIEQSSYERGSEPVASCEIQDEVSGPINANPQTSVSGNEVTVRCRGFDNAGNQAQPDATKTYVIVEPPPPPPPPPVNNEVYATDFNDLNNWEKCWSNAVSATTKTEGSETVAYLTGRKRATGCIKHRISIDTAADNYSFTCDVKTGVGGQAYLEIYYKNQRSSTKDIEYITNTSFDAVTATLQNPSGQVRDIDLRIYAKRKRGKDAQLSVNSCSLVANN